MARSNYKVLTDVDLSNNSLLNVSNITNTEEDSKSLSINTKGATELAAASLTSSIDGEMSLETGTSKVTVNNTATETVTTSKLTKIATTTENVNSTGITVSTPSQTIIATGSSKVESPSVTLVTGSPEGDGTNKQAKIALTKSASKDDSAIAVSARKVTVDATNSITQTAPESIYKTAENNKIVLNSEGITLTNVSETVKLGDNQTSIDGTKLYVSADTVDVNNDTTTITSGNGITAKTDTGSELKILTDETTLKSPVVTLNGTGSNGVTIKSGDTNSSSIVVKNTSVNIDSKDTLSISADKGITLSDEKSVRIIAPSISETATNGTISNTAGTLTLTANRASGGNAGSSTLTVDGKKTTLNTVDSTITATSITQTAPTSIYKADSNNSLELETGSVKIKSGEETITLAKSGGAVAANTKINSNDLTITAAKMNVAGNTTASITSSTSITATATSSDGTSTITTKPAKIELTSKETLLTASVNKDGEVKNSSIALSPANAESSLALTTDGKLNITSTGGARVGDGTSLTLTAPKIVETASNSIRLSSSNINLQNAETGATKTIALDNARISIAANNAKVDITGNNSGTPDTVTVSGAEFKVSSGKSTFAENSKFDKNVEIVGNLTTHNMIGEAAELNSLNVNATTTVTGDLTTETAKLTSATATSLTAKDLEARSRLTASGLVSIDGTDGSGKSLTVSKTASVGSLTVKGELKTETGGVTSAGSVVIQNNGSAAESLKVANTAEVKNLSVPGGVLKASSGMTSKGAVTVTGTTSVGTITGTGSLNIPGAAVLEATNGGTTGSVGVTKTAIYTIKGDGSLEIPASSKLAVATNSNNTSSTIAVTNTEIATIKGDGSLEIPASSKLTINNGGSSGTSTTGKFTPTDITINTIEGDGCLVVPGGKTLTASNGGTINGSMTIGESNSTATNLKLYGNATIGTSGSNSTTLTSHAKIQANSTLTVEKDATFKSNSTVNGNAEVKGTFTLNGVTIEWNSSLGALTFSRG